VQEVIFNFCRPYGSRKSLISKQWADDIRKVLILVEILQSSVQNDQLELQFVSRIFCGVLVGEVVVPEHRQVVN
jgi:hypothetical protein